MVHTKPPKVSVIMPAFNAEKYIAEAVKSVLDQTFGDFEFIIINDGSTDGTRDVLEQFRLDPRVRLHHCERNSGIVNALNLGLQLAKGEFIARMDADDIALPTRLERQVKWLESNREAAICGSWFQHMNSGYIVRLPVLHAEICVSFLWDNPFGHPTVMLRKEKLLKLASPEYLAEQFPAEDYELWMRMLRESIGGNIPEVLLDYRIHEQQISFSNPKQVAKAAELRKHWAIWVVPWVKLLPNKLWRAFDEAFQQRPLRLRKALVARALMLGFLLTNMLLRRLDSTQLSISVRERNPMLTHRGWVCRWLRRLSFKVRS